MNKKLLSSCLVLSICAIAVAPIYKQLDLKSNTTVHPTTQWKELHLEKVSSIRQQVLANDYTVTYPQDEKKTAVLVAKTKAPTSTTNKPITTIKKPTVSRSSTSEKTTRTAAPSTRTTQTTSTSKTTASIPLKPSRSTSSSTTVSSKATAIIATAKSLIGVPYVWGGVSSSGFDCSGFSQYVLNKNGITVPRTAAEQYKSGVSVSKSNLQVGDLVFFTTYKPGPSHLGFYLGNGDFIHASSSKGVTISNMSSTYYSSRYIGARRVIN